MARVIALAGKGGTGKTTVAGLMVRALRQNGHGPVLAVDADPNSCLDVAIGLSADKTVSDVLDESRGLRDVPQSMPKPTYVEYQLEDCLAEGRGVDLIVMGRPEGQEAEHWAQARDEVEFYKEGDVTAGSVESSVAIPMPATGANADAKPDRDN